MQRISAYRWPNAIRFLGANDLTLAGQYIRGSQRCGQRAICVLVTVGLACLATRPVPADEALSPQQILSNFDAHCGECHTGEDAAGDVAFVGLSWDALQKQVELIDSLVNVLDSKQMPPEDQPDLPPALRAQLVGALKQHLNRTLASQLPTEGTPIRRMNRFQYNNAVTDLFDLQCVVFTLPERMLRDHNGYFQPALGRMPAVVQVGSRPLGKSQLIEKRLAGVAAFPQDLRAEHGFDNRGDHLSLSPLLLESFLRLGESITSSPDFNAENVGIWEEFFAEPSPRSDWDGQIGNRLRGFLRRAFRGHVDEEIVERYSAYARMRLAAGLSFSDAMRSAAAAVVASPRFLYLYSPHREHDSSQLTDWELASRLSFFLWGSIPDSHLLDLAERHELSKPDVLLAEAERMLGDRKLKRFCDSFPSQWLQLERIISSVPDRERFPEFYYLKYRQSMHMMLEPLLLFETVLIEDRPLSDLIAPRFSYRSSLLESAYGELASPDGKQAQPSMEVAKLRFRRVALPDLRAGGVITNAAVMTMTSGPTRTQPITRGAWIAATIFNDPPAPPPADVPPLAEEPEQAEANLTLRERLALHRQRADCRGCHEQIDPLGFALENYDPVGRWREHYENERAIDASGVLLRAYPFEDIVQFKQALLREQDRFARALGGHLLSFALARELTAADQPALDALVAGTVESDYKMQALMKQVIMSASFRQR